jgi:protein O-GlcNAc transferase
MKRHTGRHRPVPTRHAVVTQGAATASRAVSGSGAGGDVHRAGLLLTQAVHQHQTGQLDAAERLYQDVLRLVADQPDALHLLGVLALQRGQPADAVARIARAVAQRPQNSVYHANLGVAYQALGQTEDARASLKQAVALDPANVDATFNLGVTLQVLGQLDDAAAHYIQTLALRPDHSGARQNLGNTLVSIAQAHHQADRLDAASATYRQGLALRPANPEGWHGLGRALQVTHQIPDAIASQRRALAELDAAELAGSASSEPGLRLAILKHLAAAQYLAVQPVEAADTLRVAAAVAPDDAAIWRSLGTGLGLIGNNAEAAAAYERALALNPADPTTHSMLIFVRDILPVTTLDEAFVERRAWNERHARPLARFIRPHQNTPDPARRLRVGYVSGDFKQHSVASAILPILRAHDHAQLEIVCYANVREPDAITDQFRTLADVWHDVLDLSDDALDALIRADGIDLLIDLSGHSGGNRLPVFARGPAPVQITAWGYAAGTGLDTMHYFLADPIVIPAEARAHYTEEVIDLPSLLCYAPAPDAPTVGPLPALSRGHLTFGAFNRLPKISAEAVAVWGRILAALPTSRLIVKSTGLESPVPQAWIAEGLQAQGARADQVSFLGLTSRRDHLVAHNEIDLMLDTFPQGGGITTLDSLLMGVPVVTLLGARIPGRTSASFLTTLGLADLVASTTDEYVEIATRQAHELDRLAPERATLRERLMTSPIGNAQQYVRAVEATYRSLWQRWCNEKSGTLTPALSQRERGSYSNPDPATGEGQPSEMIL